MRPRARWRELLLLPLPPILVALGYGELTLLRGDALSGETLWPALALGGLLVVAHLTLSLGGSGGDGLLLPAAAMLVGIGVIAIQRLVGWELATRQVIWFALGLGAMLVVALWRSLPLWLSHYRYLWAFGGLALLAVTALLGTSSYPGGPRLWLDFRLFSFQPSEVLKVLLVVFLASYLEQYGQILGLGHYRLGPLRLWPLPHLLPLVGMWTLTLFLLVTQRDLGAALLFFGVFLAMVYAATARWLYILVGGGSFVAAAALAYRVVGVVQQRLGIWLDPWSQADAGGYQLVQGLIALASGGIFGSGLGFGQPQAVPLAHTDYVLGAIGEEIGLVGSLAVVLLYLVLIGRGYRIALSCPPGFAQLLAAGLTTVFALQTLLIMAGNLRVLPLTGITLPFVSYGGSSLLTNFLIVGLLLLLSHQNALAERQQTDRGGGV